MLAYLQFPFFEQFIVEAMPVEREGDVPVLFEPLITSLRQVRYTSMRDLYVWDYPLSYEDMCSFVSIEFLVSSVVF